MNILAMDTSQKKASVAIVAGERLRALIFIDNGRHHSEVIMSSLDQTLLLAGLKLDELDLFAVTIGPGSFTGLRIGAATVKGLALSTGKPVIGVSTLDALAMNAVSNDEMKLICPMLDAQKNQVYTALYGLGAGSTYRPITPEQVTDVDEWLKGIKGSVYFIGDGAIKYANRIYDRFATRACIAEEKLNDVCAATVATLARDSFLQGNRLDLFTFTPRYLRRSEAERSVIRNTSGIDNPPKFG